MSDKITIFVKIRWLIGKISWKLFLWGYFVTDKEFMREMALFELGEFDDNR